MHQAVAVRINFSIPFTLCSIYISRSHNLSHQSLHDLFVQLPPPLVIMGDFNSYNQLWGSETTDARGRSIQGVVNELDLNILNNGNST